jgi:hypothetical protein
MAVMTAIAIGSLIYGVASKAIAAHKAGNAAKRAGLAAEAASDSQAELADWNASVADLQAKDAVTRGKEAEDRFRSSVDQMVGTQRATFAASNVDVGFGSALDVQADAVHLGELDALTIRSNAAREAWGFKMQAEDLRRRATITRTEGDQQRVAGQVAKSASNWEVGTTIATGVGHGALLAQSYGVGGGAKTPTLASRQITARTLTGPRLS